jgi:hypothetical protein
MGSRSHNKPHENTNAKTTPPTRPLTTQHTQHTQHNTHNTHNTTHTTHARTHAARQATRRKPPPTDKSHKNCAKHHSSKPHSYLAS